MAKPKPVEVLSDDLTITIDGETFTPHEGESVTLLRGLSVGAINAINQLINIAPAIDAASGESNEGARVMQISDQAFQQLCRALAPRIVSWTWTDAAGRPLPQPDGTADPLQALETEELAWLLSACKGETAGARKNG